MRRRPAAILDALLQGAELPVGAPGRRRDPLPSKRDGRLTVRGRCRFSRRIRSTMLRLFHAAARMDAQDSSLCRCAWLTQKPGR